MTKLDAFESRFRSADKPVYLHEPIEFRLVMVVTDLSAEEAAPLLDQIRAFLSVLQPPDGELEWLHVSGADFADVGQLLAKVTEAAPDLVVTYRHLHSQAWQWPHGLGEYLDVLAQATAVPVLVLPHPDADRALPHTLANTDRVMAITDHLTSDARLVNYALQFTAAAGTCWLTHIESQRHFDHFQAAIAKIPEIDSDDARPLIEAQLLKEPRDYIESCRAAIQSTGTPPQIESIVAMGDRIEEYRRLIEDHRIDLLVLNTMDGDQLAMHGQAYPLAVELREVPLLML